LKILKISISISLLTLFSLGIALGADADQSAQTPPATFDASNLPNPTDLIIFDHISDYAGLPTMVRSETVPTFQETPALKQSENILNPNDQASNSILSGGTVTEFYDFRNYWYGYYYNEGDVSFSPYMYSYWSYSYNWQPTTFSLPEPATSITMNVYDYLYYYNYYGAVLIAYDESGDYLGQVSSNHYGWNNVTYTAPAGSKIGHFVLQHKYYSNYSFYLQYMWITYENNQAPVAAAGADQSFDCVVDSQAVTLDGSGSADSDGDVLSYSWSTGGQVVSTSASFATSLTAGTYTYTLTVSDGSETSSDDVQIVIVADTEAPVITLLGDNPMDLGLYLAYVEAGYGAVDACGTAFTFAVTGSVDINQPGSNTLTYTATDAGGNISSVDRVVEVFNTAPDVVNAVVSVELSYGDLLLTETIDLSTVFADIDINDVLSYTFTNSNAGAATASLTGPLLTFDAVDLGTSEVTITATDPWGAYASQSFTVTVNVTQDLAEALLFGYSEIKLKKEVVISSGNILVNETYVSDDEDDEDDDIEFELKIDKEVYVASGYMLKANHIEIKQDGLIESDVYANILDNSSDITGQIFGDVVTPLFTNLPPFKAAPAGTENVTVDKNQTLVLAPGDYKKIKVNDRGTLTFTGGVYNIEKLEAKKSSHVNFENATEVRIEEEMKLSKRVYVGPADGSLIDASDIIFYIGGDDDDAAKLEEEVEFYGTIYAATGEVELKKEVSFTGSILAPEIKIDKESELALDSFFGGSGGVAKGVSATWDEPAMDPELPEVSALAGNYPNPFNPSTTINFVLSDASNISLKIFDVLGAEVATVASGHYDAGQYSVHFVPENLSSGTYLYVLDTGSMREVKRMVYLK